MPSYADSAHGPLLAAQVLLICGSIHRILSDCDNSQLLHTSYVVQLISATIPRNSNMPIIMYIVTSIAIARHQRPD